MRQIRAPSRFTDFSVEQVIPVHDGLAGLVSEAADPEGLTRSRRVFLLE